jgi:hypothetical protein
MNMDGTNRRKIFPNPVLYFDDVSPDGKWIVVEIPLSDEEGTRESIAIPEGGGTPVPICTPGCDAIWSPDGKFFYLALGGDIGFMTNKTYAFPVPPGKGFPALPVRGLTSLKEALAIPGAREIRLGKIFASPDPSTYVISKRDRRSNLFRIPIN